ncbi:acyltransferase family protein [Actinoplanes aureus]|uniref:Acyltransferase n=1 Tax=Actinoplanes aureus TaxID=2792083 RepID=A0A931CFA3_9ACTN|nr:acyltransferase family protein [Actinoplanes aureus]MBG0566181.1 acyltransferase [Actinoplanes aureus]
MSVTYDTVVEKPQPRTPAIQAATPRSHLGFRPDIEGMRAIAVMLVVLSHAGLTGLAGGYVGVDVFFVISGFLITTLLLNEVARTGTVSLAGFYARRAIRLLPASALVLVATVAGAWFWLPSTRFNSISLDALYATFYGINWRLASEGVDYLNADAAPSPLQHFWSLAVEEQFYLVWPLLMLVFTLTWTKRKKGGKAPLAAALFVITAASLAVSVTQTETSAPWAYFGAHTRAWELAVGALVAIGASRLAGLPAMLATALTWGGLAAVVASAVIYDEQTPFPGTAAALPVLGAAAIIAAGGAAPRGGASVLLRTKPFQLIGRYSYSFYLWHWPVLMIGPAALDVEPSIEVNLALAAGSLVLAVVSYHVVENPVRTLGWIKSRSWRGLGLGLALSGATAGFAMVAGEHTPPLATGGPAADTARAIAEASDPRARIRELLQESAALRRLPNNLSPNPTRARKDKPIIYRDDCHLGYPETAAPNPCVYGNPAATDSMFLLGDSHAAHWFPAVNEIAVQRDLKLASRTKSNCQAATALIYSATLKRPYQECFQWRESVLREIERTKPKFVVVSSNGGDSGGMVDANSVPLDDGPNRDQVWAAAWGKTFDRVKAAGSRIVLIEDTPWPSGSAPECLVTNPKQVRRCGRPPGEAIAEPARRELIAEAARRRGAVVIDTQPWFCTDEICPAIIGNALVWKDNSHLSTAISAAMTPLLARAFPR